MPSKEKKRRFFDESKRDAGGVSAKDFVRRAGRHGFDLDQRSGEISVRRGASPLADQYHGLLERQSQEQDPNTQRGARLVAERRKLLWHMKNHGARYYTEKVEGGGTALYMYDVTDYRGRKQKRPVKIAESARDGLSPADFHADNATGTIQAPELREDIMVDNFTRFYNVLTGETSLTTPTKSQQEAADFYDKLQEAGSLISEDGKEAGNGSQT